jgi:dTDP-4-amino-4,6-dideoxygalactose transaminase
MVVTSDDEIAERLLMLRNHGCKQKYYHLIPGFNSRLDAIQAAVLNVKLKHLDQWIAKRRENARLYAEALRDIDGIKAAIEKQYCKHCFNYYTVRLNDASIDRKSLQNHLKEKRIATTVYYPLALHLQEIFSHLGYRKGGFPVSEQLQEEVLSLPMYAELSEEQIAYIAECIGGFL